MMVVAMEEILHGVKQNVVELQFVLVVLVGFGQMAELSRQLQAHVNVLGGDEIGSNLHATVDV